MADVSDEDDNVPLIELVKRFRATNESTDTNTREEIDVIIEENNHSHVDNCGLVLDINEIGTADVLYEDIDNNLDISEIEISNDDLNLFNFSVDSESNLLFGEIDQLENGFDSDISTNDSHNISEEITDQHAYAKPSNTHVSRKRARNEVEWKQNVRKRRRQHGKEYTTGKGIRVPMRKSEATNCKCKYKCNIKIDEKIRNNIFDSYWANTFEGQRCFIRKYVTVIEKKRRIQTTSTSRRNNTLQYFLPVDAMNHVQVCKTYFLKALGIGERTVLYTIQKSSALSDKRGSKSKSRISELVKDTIRNHINRFPKTESHYCRKESQRQYLDKTLTIRKMYRLYVDECKKQKMDTPKFWLYEKIFKEEFNLGFHHPKKDLCSFCESFKHLTGEDKETKQTLYNEHQKRKDEARKQKSTDKATAVLANRDECRVLNFDMQKVLICPKTDIGEVYYSRKLATYNLSVYDVVTREAKCYMWSETTAKRGSNEIASCLFEYNKSLGPVKHVIYYSDSCTGQQRNLFFSSMCLYSVVNLPIEMITHKYFERGHSQMEGDSVHATVEKYVKKTDVFAPYEYFSAVKNCKVNQPKYTVFEVNQSDVLDFKQLSANTISNRNVATDLSKVQWNKIHSFQYRKCEPNTVYFRYNYDDHWLSFEINRKTRRSTNLKSMKGYKLLKLYNNHIPISDEKFADLTNLCQSSVIPPIYHPFYYGLPHGKVEARLPEPDESEDSV